MEDLLIHQDEAAKLAFTDASKTISDLKSRQWQATNFSVIGLVAIATFSQSHSEECKQKVAATVFAVCILAGYGFVMWKCYKNLEIFKQRLKDVVAGWVPPQSRELLGVVDEGTIVGVACCWVVFAFVFALLVIWGLFGHASVPCKP